MDIYSLLKKDHIAINEIITELIKLDEKDDYRDVLLEQLKVELIPHSRAEETVFYNSIRALGSDKWDVMHSFKDHMEAEALFRTLQLKETTHFSWKDTAIKLKEALDHHIAEEEGQVFTEARKMFSQEEAEMMGTAFLKLKTDVQKQGLVKNSFDAVVNLMPPRFVNKVKGLHF